MLAASVDDAPAGFLAVLAGEGTRVIDLVAVAADRRGAGLGAALVRRFLTLCAEAGARAEVGSQVSNVGALRLYEELGFRTVGHALRPASPRPPELGARVRIAGKDSDAAVIVIAELGNNHEGDPEVALELVRAAAAGGADAVKLQTSDPHWFVRPDNEARMAQMERFRLGDEDIARVRDLAHAEGLAFLSTPLDLPSVELLEPLVDAYKIASGDNDVPQLLERVAETRKPMVVSTGMSDLAGIRAAKEIVERRWAALGHDGELAIMHCVSAYPGARRARRPRDDPDAGGRARRHRRLLRPHAGHRRLRGRGRRRARGCWRST